MPTQKSPGVPQEAPGWPWSMTQWVRSNRQELVQGRATTSVPEDDNVFTNQSQALKRPKRFASQWTPPTCQRQKASGQVGHQKPKRGPVPRIQVIFPPKVRYEVDTAHLPALEASAGGSPEAPGSPVPKIQVIFPPKVRNGLEKEC